MNRAELCEMLLKDTDYLVILDKVPKTREGVQMIIDISTIQLFYLDFYKLLIILKLFNESDPFKYFDHNTISKINSEFTAKIIHAKNLHDLSYSSDNKENLLKQNEDLKRTCDILRKTNDKQIDDISKLKILYLSSLNDLKEKDKKWQDLIELERLKIETYYDSKIIEFKENRKKLIERKKEDKETIKSLSKCRDTQCKNIKTLRTQIENLQLELKEKEDAITRYITLDNEKDLIIQGLNDKLELLNKDILKLTKIKLNFSKKENIITQLKSQIKKHKQMVISGDILTKEKQTEIDILRDRCLKNETENKKAYDKVTVLQKLSENLMDTVLYYEEDNAKENELIGYTWGDHWMYSGYVY